MQPRLAALRSFYDVFSPAHALLDRGLLLYFPPNHSFTGEEVVEFHVHGGVAAKQLFLRTLGRFPRFRHADPGEFTKRALLSGRLDMLEVEALSDLIGAETEQ